MPASYSVLSITLVSDLTAPAGAMKKARKDLVCAGWSFGDQTFVQRRLVESKNMVAK
jgi:hypothetical protein